MPLPLLALAIGAFAIGTTEFVVMGLLPQMAADLSVSIPSAGLLVTGYAMGVVVGGPILALLTVNMPRKRALMLLMGLFVFGNLLCALAPNYPALMAARFVAAFAHGSFFGTGAVVAGHVVPANKRSQALGLMFSGLTVAQIIGVPAGAWVGTALGWRTTFWGVVALGIIALVGIACFVPSLRDLPKANLRRELSVLKRPQVLLAFAMTVFGFGGVFTAFTFIVPILELHAHVSHTAVTTALVLFGVGSTFGTLYGGRLADWRLMPALSLLLAAGIVFYLVFAETMQWGWAAVAGSFALGLIGFASGPGLQTRCMQQAQEAPLLASTLNQSAFNLGNAGGAFIGAAVLDATGSYPLLGVAAAAITAIGLGLTVFSAWLERRSTSAALAVAG